MIRNLISGLTLACASLLAQAQQATPLDAGIGEQLIHIPLQSGWPAIELEATVFKPEGAGPFPMVIINHGKSPGKTALQARARYLVASRALVRRGFAVLLPMRQGFANSGGVFMDGGCQFARHGHAQAEDVLAAINYAKSLPYVDPGRLVVFGQSHGGLASLALGTVEVPGLLGIVNFAGGYRKPSCGWWEGALIDAFAEYGKAARYPSLWFYGDNDSYWQPWLRQKMFESYDRASGGKARLVAFGKFDSDAHELLGKTSGLAIWLPEVGRFLTALGLDFTLKTGGAASALKYPVPSRSGFSQIDDIAAVPFLKEKGRDAYKKWLALPMPRAFAIGASGAYAWSSDNTAATDLALDNCKSYSRGQACRLYAVDQHVVWPGTDHAF